MLSAVTAACQDLLGAPVPILLHGYDYPVPDGRGFLGGWGPLPGPWLEPDPFQTPRVGLARSTFAQTTSAPSRLSTTQAGAGPDDLE